MTDNTDIVARLKSAEAEVEGDARIAIHDAWREIVWLREALAISGRVVDRAQQRIVELEALV